MTIASHALETSHPNSAPPALSVVMSTYNRGALLEGAIRSVLAQREHTAPFELIIVDNNSSDATREIVERVAASDPRVRYVFEPQQGLSSARNTGIRVAAAPLVAFTDDDVRATPDWIAALLRAFDESPEADFVGGRVLPLWPSSPPAWLTREHWAPLALVDYGEDRLEITATNSLCLVGANVAFRVSVFEHIGMFATDFQRVKDRIGSIEDHEFQLRLLRAGRSGVYDPRITIQAEVQPNRLQRRYHRRWHQGHGHFHALLRSEDVEQTRTGTLFGVPAHLYRRALMDVIAWASALLRRHEARAFAYELRLRFSYEFFKTRRRQAHQSHSHPLRVELRRAAREADTRWHRFRTPDVRDVVFDARTAMEYGMMRPVHRRLLEDHRVRTWLLSSERPEHVEWIFGDAPGEVRRISPRAALMKRFDAYVAADFVWARLPRGARRVQMFHGVGGKWSEIYDRPTGSMRHWDRLFFINERRLRNFIKTGAVDPASAAIRLIGMPKVDCLVDGTYTRNGVLEDNGMDPTVPTIMYAPTWTPYSSLNAMGEELVTRLLGAGYRVLVKLHDNSRDLRPENSGGIDWIARLAPILRRGHGHFITAADGSPWLVAADALITDHSSIGFEYLLLDRPVIRILMPDLIQRANIPNDYVELLAAVSTTVDAAASAVAAAERAFADPTERSASRRAVAAELFHQPGGATQRATEELYALMEFDLPASRRAPHAAALPVAHGAAP